MICVLAMDKQIVGMLWPTMLKIFVPLADSITLPALPEYKLKK